ncbi:hypothetical protein DNTS_006588 [Danionella cerebrum]|uniref:Prefoldin subunit 4 n=1 Tax=Danionella cerebrum TaxID=2873325 RepID=A0A553RB60_9TELE|nr:hypothetical protein DNTS_006588 [Danionella translucida]
MRKAQEAIIRTEVGDTEWLRGVRQGCILLNLCRNVNKHERKPTCAIQPPFTRVREECFRFKMAATMKKGVAAEDVNVTFEDQQKINKFARNTNRMSELKDEIEAKKKSLQNLEDASDDLMMCEDDSMLVPYQIGDVFISHSQEETQEMLEAAKEALQDEIKALEGRVSSIQGVLGDLKIQLYAKFGNNINLDADES